MTDKVSQTRRRLLLGAIGMALAGPQQAAQSLLRPTPPQTAGPFYPVDIPLDDDNDLTRVSGLDGRANGEILELAGRILDLDGRPVKGARIEIWQCDANGRYRHPRDPSEAELDPRFQGHGHCPVDEAGRYGFRTIRPVPYPGRTPHIHVAVFPPGDEPFVTQMYVEGERRNADDFLFRRIPAERRDLVLAKLLPAQAPGVTWIAKFDLILGGHFGTPRG